MGLEGGQYRGAAEPDETSGGPSHDLTGLENPQQSLLPEDSFSDGGHLFTSSAEYTGSQPNLTPSQKLEVRPHSRGGQLLSQRKQQELQQFYHQQIEVGFKTWQSDVPKFDEHFKQLPDEDCVKIVLAATQHTPEYSPDKTNFALEFSRVRPRTWMDVVRVVAKVMLQDAVITRNRSEKDCTHLIERQSQL